METDYIAPEFKRDGFNCPHCGAYSHQEWVPLNKGTEMGGQSIVYINGIIAAKCARCHLPSLWYKEELVYPKLKIAPFPLKDMPEDAKRDYEEARTIASDSPRSACALLRLALQKLMIHLGEKGKDLNDDIGNLVKRGLPERVQKALDSIRVLGNNAVHPGELDLKDDLPTANALFGLVNMVVDVMITQPKEVDSLFQKIPEGAKEAIKKRDGEK